jgi:integrase
MPRSNRPPSYRLHKARNCAVVTINGRNHYLGPYHSPESFEKYNRLIAEWSINNQSHPPNSHNRANLLQIPNPPSLSINELILSYLDWAAGYYKKHGSRTTEFDNIRCALRFLMLLFGSTPAATFGPKDLELVRQAMIEDQLGRKTINGRISRIKRMFRWGTRVGLLPPSCYHALMALEGLKRFRSPAKETPPVTTVPELSIQATLNHLNPTVRAMAQIQALTGMRPQDIRNLRTSDLETSSDVWVYTPWTHKTEHHGHIRRIAIGPKAQLLLAPFLKPNDPQSYVFSPRDTVSNLQAERSRSRKTPRTPSERNRTRKSNPKRSPRLQYSKDAYTTAIVRAAARAGVPPWSPNQLRHNAATKIRSLFGLDATAAVLGHRLGSVTEVYADADFRKAIEVMRQIG